MKKLISIMALVALVVMVSPVALADFVDYGVNSDGNQCFDQKDEHGNCDLIYTTDLTLFGGANSLWVGASVKIAQPLAPTNSERVERQNETRRQICMILGC